ncbi:MAG: putative enoyl-CoA hydratase echA8 [Chloroflexi bacterium ADurb.Bin180]|nr:MAG: putative enoyl-CoA hydratase echA8 [Chloroflexi bacterium ADurb.Bin180]
MEYHNLLIQLEGGVLTITFNRPQVLNALNAATMAELSAAIAEAEQDASVRCVILTGAGEKSFVAGADIKELRAIADGPSGAEFATRGQEILFRIENLTKPVIAAINGYALGGGCELAMACDIRIAADTAKLGQPEINLGIIPGYGGTQRLVRLVGKGQAKWLVLSGETISAQEALRIGLVDRVVPAGELMAVALDLARRIAAKPPIAVALAKSVINAGSETDLATACAYEASQFGLACATEDRLEGTAAFLEKRQPSFKGK